MRRLFAATAGWGSTSNCHSCTRACTKACTKANLAHQSVAYSHITCHPSCHTVELYADSLLDSVPAAALFMRQVTAHRILLCSLDGLRSVHRMRTTAPGTSSAGGPARPHMGAQAMEHTQGRQSDMGAAHAAGQGAAAAASAAAPVSGQGQGQRRQSSPTDLTGLLAGIALQSPSPRPGPGYVPCIMAPAPATLPPGLMDAAGANSPLATPTAGVAGITIAKDAIGEPAPAGATPPPSRALPRFTVSVAVSGSGKASVDLDLDLDEPFSVADLHGHGGLAVMEVDLEQEEAGYRQACGAGDAATRRAGPAAPVASQAPPLGQHLDEREAQQQQRQRQRQRLHAGSGGSPPALLAAESTDWQHEPKAEHWGVPWCPPIGPLGKSVVQVLAL